VSESGDPWSWDDSTWRQDSPTSRRDHQCVRRSSDGPVSLWCAVCGIGGAICCRRRDHVEVTNMLGEVSMCDTPPTLIILLVVFWFTTLFTAQVLHWCWHINDHCTELIVFLQLPLVQLHSSSAVAVVVNLRPTVSRPVCPGVRRPSGTCDKFFFLHEISFRQLRVCNFIVPSLTGGRVFKLLYNFFWALPEQSLLGRSPAELTALFYCLIWDSTNLEGQVPIFRSHVSVVHGKRAVQRGIWVPTQHLLWDQGKPRKTLIELAGRRTFRKELTSSQQSGIKSANPNISPYSLLLYFSFLFSFLFFFPTRSYFVFTIICMWIWFG
jgi:hypothetical protein